MPSLEPQVIGGKYQLGKVLGEGGIGLVYQALNLETGHYVAIKVLRSHGIRALEERLLQEGKAQAQLRHPNIVAVVDVLREAQGPMLVMEFIAGMSLDKLIETTRFSVSDLDELAKGLLAGLAAAQRQGWIHRDLKPSNILCERIDDVLITRITDFGLAKALDEPTESKLTRSGVTMGSPSFMSPEQWSNAKRVDHRTDLWSLGAVLYESACNKPAFPWDGADQKELIDRIFGGDFPDLRSQRADLPERIYRAVQAALQPDRSDRVSSCDELFELWFERPSPLGRSTADASPPSRDPVARSIWPTASEVRAVEATTPVAPVTPIRKRTLGWVLLGAGFTSVMTAALTVSVLLGIVLIRNRRTAAPLHPVQVQVTVVPPQTLTGALRVITEPEVVVNTVVRDDRGVEVAIGAGELSFPQGVLREDVPYIVSITCGPQNILCHSSSFVLEAPKHVLEGPLPEPVTPATPAPSTPAPSTPAPGTPAQAPPKPGKLMLDAHPFSEVRIDGKHVGRGLVEIAIDPGGHVIEFVVLQGPHAHSSHQKKLVARSDRTSHYCWDFDEEAVCLDWP